MRGRAVIVLMRDVRPVIVVVRHWLAMARTVWRVIVVVLTPRIVVVRAVIAIVVSVRPVVVARRNVLLMVLAERRR